MNAEEKARRLAHLTSLTRNDASTVARKRSQIDTVAVGDQSHKRPRRATPTRQSASTNVIDIIELSTTDDERTTDGEETAKSESRPTTKAVCSTSQLPAKHALITTSSLRFSTGAVLLTTAPGKPRPGHISLDDVLERHTLEMAVLSSFTSDTEWLFSKLDIGRTQVILCMHAEEDKHQRLLADARNLPKVSLFFPSLKSGISCMHSKLQLLFHRNYLRIAIPTANLVSFDWGEELAEYGPGYLDNNVFLIDLPFVGDGHAGRLMKRKSERNAMMASSINQDQIVKLTQTIPFLRNLIRFLLRADYPDHVITSLLAFDFSKTSRVDFIATIGGYHGGKAIHDSGRLALARAARQAGLPAINSPRWTALTSSLGSLDWRFLNSLARAMLSESVLGKELISECAIDQLSSSFRIAFPTMKAVKNAAAGAGVIFFSRKCIQDKSKKKDRSDRFPEPCLYEYHPRKAGILSHSKAIICEDLSSSGHGLAYIGSANLSASAWGDKVTKDQKTKQDKFFNRNWEAGVLVPLGMLEEDHLPIDLAAPFRINTDPWSTPPR